MALPRLFANLPAPFATLYDAEAPWDLLGDPLDRVLAQAGRLEGEVAPSAHLVGDGIVICKGARVYPNAVIEGPAYLGPDAQVRPGAYLRGGVWIGEGGVAGTNTEVKRAILFAGAKAPHLDYVGDSILGANVGLGAGTILSNHRHDRTNVRIDGRETGRRKLGAILGDGVLTGCGSVLHPGVVVGCETRIYPGVQLRPGIYAERSIIKLRQELEITPRA